jgi:hypothetical protein
LAGRRLWQDGAMSLFRTHSRWRSEVKHDTPKALRIRAAVDAIHGRGLYPGIRRVMVELGEDLYRSRTIEPEWIVDGEPMTYLVHRRMSGRDNVVRKQRMKELGIDVDPGPFDDDGDCWY